jgi:hypothetical protein
LERGAGNNPDCAILPLPSSRTKCGDPVLRAASQLRHSSGTTLVLVRAIVTLQAVELDCRVGFASSQ